MRCRSSGRRVRFRMDSITGGPMLRLGTKWPSMTSTWSRSAPAVSTRAMASPSAAKSADRMRGAIFMMRRPYSKVPRVAKGGSGSRPPHQPHRGEAVGAVDVGQAADHAGRVGLHREAGGRIRAPVGMLVEEGPHDGVVFLRLERAGRADQVPARLRRGGRLVADG